MDFTPNQQVFPLSYQVAPSGVVTLGGVDVQTLAERFGTPLYVLDAETMRAMAAVYRETLKTHYPAESLVLYAAKANLSMGLCRFFEQEGLGIDVVSGGELYTALSAGFPPNRICFNGNNKTRDELTYAVSNGIERIMVDNFYELALLHEVAATLEKQVSILLRVVPGIECHTHEYIKTGHLDSKFGFDLSQLPQALTLIQTEYRQTIALKGLHAHIGSQIFEEQAYLDLVELLLNVYYNIRQNYDGLTLSDLNIGGGMGIAYTPSDTPLNVSVTLQKILQKMVNYANTLSLPLPRLFLEPGRSMVATAGTTLYRIGGYKQVPEGRKYVFIDGGMGDNIRPALYQASYSAVVANKANQEPKEQVTVAGKYCESGDVLMRDVFLPTLEAGDLFLVFATGAYNESMASNYNRFAKPATVLVDKGDAHLLVARQSYADLIQYDRMPATL